MDYTLCVDSNEMFTSIKKMVLDWYGNHAEKDINLEIKNEKILIHYSRCHLQIGLKSKTTDSIKKDFMVYIKDMEPIALDKILNMIFTNIFHIRNIGMIHPISKFYCGKDYTIILNNDVFLDHADQKTYDYIKERIDDDSIIDFQKDWDDIQSRIWHVPHYKNDNPDILDADNNRAIWQNYLKQIKPIIQNYNECIAALRNNKNKFNPMPHVLSLLLRTKHCYSGYPNFEEWDIQHQINYIPCVEWHYGEFLKIHDDDSPVGFQECSNLESFKNGTGPRFYETPLKGLYLALY